VKKEESKVLNLKKVKTIVRTHETFISREKRHELLALLEQKSTQNLSITNQKLKICLRLAMTQIYGKKTFDRE
jgi:hypothetical protein